MGQEGIQCSHMGSGSHPSGPFSWEGPLPVPLVGSLRSLMPSYLLPTPALPSRAVLREGRQGSVMSNSGCLHISQHRGTKGGDLEGDASANWPASNSQLFPS